MQGIFGMLLVGGGIILMVGIFTGKITFPLSSTGTTTSGDSSLGSVTGAAATGKKPPKSTGPTPGGPPPTLK